MRKSQLMTETAVLVFHGKCWKEKLPRPENRDGTSHAAPRVLILAETDTLKGEDRLDE